MKIEDLTHEVASEVVDGDKKQIGLLLLMVIGAIITEIIHWFFAKYINKEKAAKEFLDYYNKMGPIRRISWALKVRSEMKTHPETGVPSSKMATVLANKFKNLTIEDVMELSQKK